MSDDPPPKRSRSSRMIWTVAGWAALGVGAIGAVLPVLPTTPLVLLAAFCFGKGSPRLRGWLLGNAMFGPAIQRWEDHGAIPRSAKTMACIMMAATFAVSLFAGLSFVLLALQGGLMAIGAAYVLSRPDE